MSWDTLPASTTSINEPTLAHISTLTAVKFMATPKSKRQSMENRRISATGTATRLSESAKTLKWPNDTKTRFPSSPLPLGCPWTDPTSMVPNPSLSRLILTL